MGRSRTVTTSSQTGAMSLPESAGGHGPGLDLQGFRPPNFINSRQRVFVMSIQLKIDGHHAMPAVAYSLLASLPQRRYIVASVGAAVWPRVGQYCLQNNGCLLIKTHVTTHGVRAVGGSGSYDDDDPLFPPPHGPEPRGYSAHRTTRRISERGSWISLEAAAGAEKQAGAATCTLI